MPCWTSARSSCAASARSTATGSKWGSESEADVIERPFTPIQAVVHFQLLSPDPGSFTLGRTDGDGHPVRSQERRDPLVPGLGRARLLQAPPRPERQDLQRLHAA